MKPRAIKSEDWRTLQFTPFWAFQCVAGIDGHIDKEERAAFLRCVHDAAPSGGKVAEDVLREVKADLDGIIRAWNTDPRTAPEGLKEVSVILAKLSAAETTAFGEMLVGIGRQVAHASGGGIGLRERTALRGMAAILGVEETEPIPATPA